MAPTIDATVSGSSSNSYITLEDATGIAQNMPFADGWNSTSDDDLVVALITATRWLETLTYAGDRCKASQRLKWPRSGAICDGVTSDCAGIPWDIQEAEVVLAWAWVDRPSDFPGQEGGSDSGSSTPPGVYVSSKKLGDLQIDYAAYPGGESSTDNCIDCSNPAIINSFPWLTDLLKCWADTAVKGNRVLMRVRS